MKRILLFTLVLFSTLISQRCTAQCIERGNSIIDFSAKLGVYNDLIHVHQTTFTKSDHAGSGIYTLGYEITPFKWLGVGLQLRYDKYMDSASQKQTTYSFNVPVYFNIHFVHTTHVDLYAGMAFGFSTFNVNGNDASVTKLSGVGSLFDIHAAPRFFLGKHFAISIPISYTSFSYPQITATNNTTTINNWADLTLGGLNIGLGLNYKF
ncbi:MAG: outer membrane beta-barrel protein [Bacteroidia bacterium]